MNEYLKTITPEHSAAVGGYVAGIGAPRHARALRPRKSEAAGRAASRAQRGKARPATTTFGHPLPHEQAAKRCALDYAATAPLRAPVAGRALRGAVLPARACGHPCRILLPPPQIAPLREAHEIPDRPGAFIRGCFATLREN